jgi:CheY-like chemotaxis protein
LGFFKVLKKPFTNETLLMVLENIRTGNVFRKKNALFVNCPNEHASNIRLLGEKLGYQFFFIETLEKGIVCLKSDSKIGTVFCYESKNSQKDCEKFALETKAICRYDDSGNAIVPSLILVTPHPTEITNKTPWDKIVAETADYRSLAILMHELQDKNNEGQIENPRQMVIVLGDIGINVFFLEKTLSESGYNLLAVDSPSEAYQLLNSDLGSDISLILSSSHVNDTSIEEFIASCQTIRRTDALFVDQALPFIITTDFPNDPIFQKLPTLSSTQVFLRPIDVPAFRGALVSVLGTPSMKVSL